MLRGRENVWKRSSIRLSGPFSPAASARILSRKVEMTGLSSGKRKRAAPRRTATNPVRATTFSSRRVQAYPRAWRAEPGCARSRAGLGSSQHPAKRSRSTRTRPEDCGERLRLNLAVEVEFLRSCGRVAPPWRCGSRRDSARIAPWSWPVTFQRREVALQLCRCGGEDRRFQTGLEVKKTAGYAEEMGHGKAEGNPGSNPNERGRPGANAAKMSRSRYPNISKTNAAPSAMSARM